MNYSRRQLYALGEPLGDSVTTKKVSGGRIYGGGGGGGGSSAPQQSTTYNTNVPEYAKPYVTTMLGATQKQLFEGTPTGEGGFDITGFKPYRPYSTDVNNYFAGFSPLQQQAQTSVRGLQTPGQFGDATTLAGAAGLGSLGAGQQYNQNVTDPARMQAFMSPYQQSVTDIAKTAAVREAQMAQNAQNLGAARQGTYGGARQALMQSEREKNLLSNLSNIQAQGSQSAFDRAMQAQQFGSTLGMQGYGQAGQAASTLGQLGGAQLGAQKDIIGLQNQMGGQQQALEQAKINQSIQDYATQQQYPLMQLGMMSNMLRGLPLQATTTQTYQAQPSNLNQGLGLLAGAAGAKQAGLFAEGGTIKGLAEGGVTGYANRGLAQANPRSAAVQGIKAKLEMMPIDQLQQVAQSSSSEEVRTMALEVLQEKKIRAQAEQQAQQSIAQDQQAMPTPVSERAGLPAAPAGAMDTLNAASGGIVAFANEGEVELDPEEAARLQQEFLSRQKYENFARKQREAAGVGAPKAALGEFYAKEQAALGDAEKQARGYDLLNFGINLATQAGPLAQAGARAGQATLPGMIARQEGLRERRGGVAKGLAEVAEGERLMKLGDITGGNAMFEKAEERLSKEKVASTRASVADRADNHARGYLADARAKGDKRPEEIVLLEGRNDYLNKVQQAQMARAGVAAQQVNITGQNLTRDDANKEIREVGTPGNDRFKAELKKAQSDTNYKNLSPAEKKKIKADIKERVRDEIMTKNQSGGGSSKPKTSSKANPADFDS